MPNFIKSVNLQLPTAWTNVLVWYPIGVEKLALDANMTATVNGMGLNPKLLDNCIAIGVTSNATALLDTNSVNNQDITYMKNKHNRFTQSLGVIK